MEQNYIKEHHFQGLVKAVGTYYNYLERKKLPMRTRKNQEIILSYIFFACASALAIVLKLNFMVFTILFIGPVVAYLGLKLKKLFYKIFLESLVISIPMEVILDTIAHQSKAWFVPSVFGIQLFNSMPIDDLLWTFLYVLLILLSYEYFFDHYRAQKLAKNFKKLAVLFGTLLVLFTISYYVFAITYVIPYFYAVLMVLFLVYTIVGLLLHPKLYQHTSLMTLYMLLPSILFELVALKLGHWYFENGYHLGYLVISSYSVPLEEILFYFLAITTTVLTHELFCDNKRG